MDNRTNMKIPQKYAKLLSEVYHDGDDGYWAYTIPGYMFEGLGTHGAHELRQKDLMEVIRTIVPCNCSECK